MEAIALLLVGILACQLVELFALLTMAGVFALLKLAGTFAPLAEVMVLENQAPSLLQGSPSLEKGHLQVALKKLQGAPSLALLLSFDAIPKFPQKAKYDALRDKPAEIAELWQMEGSLEQRMRRPCAHY